MASRTWFRSVSVAAVALALGGCSDSATRADDPDAGVDQAPTISGTVWNDIDSDGERWAGEPALQGHVVYLDADDNGALDDGEPTAVTDASGRYVFEGLVAGDYVVRQQMTFGWRNVSGGEAVQESRSSTRGKGRARRAHKSYRIIGGADAGIDAYPFMVAVGELEEDKVFQFCGGALISDRWVVTAAHCTDGDAAGVGVWLGTDDLAGDGGEVFEVASQHTHPDGDLALWELAEPVDLVHGTIYTVDMASAETETLTAPGAVATAIGWGVGAPGSVLQQVHLPILSAEECQQSYPDDEIAAAEICAGVPEGGIDACQGDSGGPLLVRDREGRRWLHAGVTSWGEGCALPDKPGVYARTSVLSAWAMELATEPSRVYRVSVGADSVTADFGDAATTRPLIGDIAPRWQLTALQAPETVEPNQPVSIGWRVLDAGDAPALELACALDPDGGGAAEEVQVACATGDNDYDYAGYETGVYLLRLTVTAAGRNGTRETVVVAGTPEHHDAAGELTDADPTDPDYPDVVYRTDYYELTSLTPGVAALVEVASSAFEPYVSLYDADERTPSGGGLIRNTEARFALVPEAGRRYLLGVSTFEENETGAYTVSVVGNGVPTPVSISSTR